MKRLGTLIHTNAWGDEVYAVSTTNKNDMRVSAELYFETADGRISELFTVRKQDIMVKKDYLKFLYDFEIDLGRDDIDVIRNKIFELMKPDKEKERVQVQTRATFEEVHACISDYIRENEQELKDNPKAEVFLKNNYGYITSMELDKFIKENKELGYKRLDLLKLFKIRGALVPSTKRTYDYQMSINGNKLWFYRFILLDKVDVEDEEIEVITL